MSLFRREPRREPILPARLDPPPVARPMKISHEALAYSRTREAAPTVSPWQIAKPLPGVLPAAMVAKDAPLAMDYAPFYGEVAGGGFGGYGGAGPGVGWFGYPYLVELSQLPEYRSVSETIAREMVREWIELTSTGDDDKTDRIAKINAGLDRFRIRESARRIGEHDGFLGKAHLFVDTGATGDELATPLIVDKRTIGVGKIKAFRVVSPMWVYPTGYDSTNPLSPDFYRPLYWYVNGIKVHRSRLLTFIGREVEDLLKPNYQFGGLSRSQMIKPAVDNWLQTRASVGKLVDSFSVFHLATNMSSVLTGGGGEVLMQRAQLFNNYRTNDGMMLTDKDTEEFSNVSAQLGTLDKLQAQSQEHVYSLARIPLVIGTGLQPSGLNASSDGELEVWNTTVMSEQWHLFGANLKTIIDLVQLNECGDIDPEIGFRFLPLGAMDAAALAAIRKTNADTAAVSIAGGWLLPEEERQRVATEEGSLYANIDLSTPLPEPQPDDLGSESDKGGEVTEGGGGDEA